MILVTVLLSVIVLRNKSFVGVKKLADMSRFLTFIKFYATAFQDTSCNVGRPIRLNFFPKIDIGIPIDCVMSNYTLQI